MAEASKATSACAGRGHSPATGFGGGIALIIEGIAGLNPLVFAGIVALVVVLPIVSSYVLYKNIEGFESNGA